MPVPLVGLAIGAAAKAVAKKAVKKAVAKKTAAKKASTKPKIAEPKSAVKVVKSSPSSTERMNMQRTAAGRARELNEARRAEQIRTAKAAARLAKIKTGK